MKPARTTQILGRGGYPLGYIIRARPVLFRREIKKLSYPYISNA